MSIATLSDVESLERVPVADRLAAGSTLGLLRDMAARHGDRIALRFIATADPGAPVTDLSYAAFLRRIVQAANLFRSLGAGDGDAVSSLLPLSPETFVAAFGAQCAAAANPINFLLEPEQIAAILREARCRVLLAPDPELLPGIWEKVEGIAASVPTLRTIVRVGGPAVRPGSDAPHFETELDRQPRELTFERAIGPGDVAALFHTGGTTSTPKLARHTHAGLLLGAWTNAQIWEIEANDVLFNGLPALPRRRHELRRDRAVLAWCVGRLAHTDGLPQCFGSTGFLAARGALSSDRHRDGADELGRSDECAERRLRCVEHSLVQRGRRGDAGRTRARGGTAPRRSDGRRLGNDRVARFRNGEPECRRPPLWFGRNSGSLSRSRRRNC